MESTKTKRRIWTDEETKAFIRAYSKRQAEFLGSKKRKYIMAKVLRELESQGVLTKPTTTEMLMNKVKNMGKAFKTSGERRKMGENSKNEIEDLMEEVFGTGEETTTDSTFNLGSSSSVPTNRRSQSEHDSFYGQIILQVEKYPILYDSDNADLIDPNYNVHMWEQIGKELHEKPSTVKQIWSDLRDTYLTLVKENPDKSGIVWRWFYLMDSFMSPNSKITIKNECQPITNNHEEDDEEFFNSVIESDDTCSQTNISDYKTKPITRNPIESLNEPTLIHNPRTIHSKLHQKRTLTNVSRVSTSIESLAKLLKTHQQPELDETDMLFLAHARNLKKFSRRRQAIAKMKVSQVLMEMELKDIEEKAADNSNEIMIHSPPQTIDLE